MLTTLRPEQTILLSTHILGEVERSCDRVILIHRGTVVRCDAIAIAVREESGKLTLTLRGHADKLTVSRMYAHLFKGM